MKWMVKYSGFQWKMAYQGVYLWCFSEKRVSLQFIYVFLNLLFQALQLHGSLPHEPPQPDD